MKIGWDVFGFLVGAVLAAAIIKEPLKKLCKNGYEWLARVSPRLAKAIDDLLSHLSNSFGPGE